MKSTLKKAYNFIKENPDCIIEYVDNEEFWIMTKKQRKEINLDDIYDAVIKISDYYEGYIPTIAILLQNCVKRGIDITKIKIITN
jgi:hypothetical protein